MFKRLAGIGLLVGLVGMFVLPVAPASAKRGHDRGELLEVLKETAADFLDMSEEELVDELRAGNSLADIAEDEGESVDDLVDALVEAVEDLLDDAVEDGKISDDQRDEIVDKLDEWVTALVHHEFRARDRDRSESRGHGGGRGLVKSVLLEAAADYLDMDEEDLVDELRAGKSLADVADDEDESVDGLIDALVDAAEEALDDAVDEGRLSEKKRDKIVDKLDRWITKIVERKNLRFN